MREEVVGKVRVVYAEMDDGMVHLMPYQRWLSGAGVPWPWKDEFEVGCTLEHAGYYLTWLAAWFGPAISVTSFASIQAPDKLTSEPLNLKSPDFSVPCIQFADGVVARLTCSILAPHNHSLKVVGDKGVLYTEDSWQCRSPVWSRRMMRIRRKTFLNPSRTSYNLPRAPYSRAQTKGALCMDFARGPTELAAALREGRAPRLSPRFSLHVNELALAIHYAREQGATYRMTTGFDPIEPMDWAQWISNTGRGAMGGTIRWGFWGSGAVARDVAADMLLVADAELHAVASRSPARAVRFAARSGAARSYGSLDDLLNDEAVDAVYIATPHTLHMEDSLKCIAAGKAVLCEKPFTLNAQQGQKGGRRCAGEGRVLHGVDVDALHSCDPRGEAPDRRRRTRHGADADRKLRLP